jgi:hypothetical protein
MYATWISEISLMVFGAAVLPFPPCPWCALSLAVIETTP